MVLCACLHHCCDSKSNCNINYFYLHIILGDNMAKMSMLYCYIFSYKHVIIFSVFNQYLYLILYVESVYIV